MAELTAKKRIIVALDVSELFGLGALIKKLSPYVGYFKVGPILTTDVGLFRVAKFIHARGGKIFYDPKLNDIPNTVGETAKVISGLGIEMFNVHASAGRKSIEAAVQNRGESLILGVTVLTSIDEKECQYIFGETPGEKVLKFSRMLLEAGAQGIICSPQELELLGKQKELSGLLKITPGIRPEWAPPGDQKRFMTPYEAIKAGADYIVVGRPITSPPPGIGTPQEAVESITTEIEEALTTQQ